MAANADQSPAASLLEISRVLEETARLVRQHAGAALEAPQQQWLGGEELSAADVRAIISVRQMRRRCLGVEASDAAWSMMLELCAARLEGRSLSQTRLAVAAGVAQTTALQATRRLLDAGVFTKAPDPDDKRLLLIGLSDDAGDRMRSYLTATLGMAGLAA
jgi:hypothetical protein